MAMASSRWRWPVLTSYTGDGLRCIAMPLGGIGTGTVSLGGRGNLRDWEIHNRPAKGSLPANCGVRDYGAGALFALYCRQEGRGPVARALEGVLQPPYEGGFGATAGFHGVPRFRGCSFHAAYPLAEIRLWDAAVPVQVRLQAFNPLVPADADASGIPIAVLRYVLTNRTREVVHATVCGSLANLAGTAGRRNTFRSAAGLQGLFMTSDGADPLARETGTMALVTTAADVSWKTRWADESWSRSLLHFWDDLCADGRLDDSPQAAAAPSARGSLAASIRLEPGASAAVTFAITWHFPNRYTWAPGQQDCGCGGPSRLAPADRLGNYYTERYTDAWDVAARTLPALAELEERTLRFVRAFCSSDLPDVVKEAALCNLSTLRTETCFRTPDGNLYGWEGCSDAVGCCSGSCTHVWNYETTTPFLFGDLARRMRDVEFLHATHPETGSMSFRVQLPLERECGAGKAAADGQMGCLLKLQREWRLSGDSDWLRRLWTRARKALEFCWLPGGWDADQDGVMEGCQHNTMDVEYFGPNPQMQLWYLGALRAAEDMALALGDAEFAGRSRRLFESGSRWLDEHLFNGEYYEHRVQPPAAPEAILPQTRLDMGTTDLRQPDLQLATGCLVDQLVGQYMAHVCGLGYLAAPAHVRRTLASIMRYNFQTLSGHFNHMRSFALNEERALLMATYPRGGRPASPFPYFSEAMTGFEYCAAAHLLYEGRRADGLRVIRAIRARYDGARRNPFDEAECGHHYARAMAAWSATLALTGFSYDAVNAALTFAPRAGRWFWSTGYAWGTCRIRSGRGARRVSLTVLHGRLTLRRFGLGEVAAKIWGRPVTLAAGGTRTFTCTLTR
jgi:non-lysosomal glucosylceramidase